jgi:Zn finger protein HypA/HybF involved in hydrogenase expression
MEGVVVFGLICLVAYLIAIGVSKSKGEIRCNKCGYIGHLKPREHRLGAVLTDQKLVCPNCDSDNYIGMKAVHMQEAAEQEHELHQRREEAQRHDLMDQGLLCPTCERRLQPGTLFCPYDGTPVSQTCKSCGHTSAPAASFCSKCGTRIQTGSEVKDA